MLIAALSTIAKTWKQPKKDTHTTDTHTQTHTLLFSHKKWGNPDTGDNMNETWGHYTKRNKLEKDRHCMISLVCGI